MDLRRLTPGHAFTLIELLVVILIIAILIAVAAPSFLGQTEKAHDSAAQQSLVVAYKAAKAGTVTEINQGSWVNAAAVVSSISGSEPQLNAQAVEDSFPSTSKTAGKLNINVDVDGTTLTLRALSQSGNQCSTVVAENGAPTTSCAPPPDTYSDFVLASGPVAYWRFEETSGTAAQPSAGAVSGTYNSVTLGATGAVSSESSNKAASFDGTNSYITVGDNFDFAGTQPFSIEAWVYPTNLAAATRTIVSKMDTGSAFNGYWLRGDTTAVYGTRYNGAGSSNTANGPALTLNAWSHVVLTFDGTTTRLYINGVHRTASSSAAVSVGDTAHLLMIGATPQSGTPLNKFSGLIDEVALYDKALTCSTTAPGGTCASGTDVADHYAAAS